MIENAVAIVLHAILVGVVAVSAQHLIFYISRKRAERALLKSYSKLLADLNPEKKSNLTVVKDKE